jgi:putative hydrolase of the HAD superfamily
VLESARSQCERRSDILLRRTLAAVLPGPERRAFDIRRIYARVEPIRDDGAVRKAIGFDLGDTLLLYEGVSERWAPGYREALGRAACACGRELGKSQADQAVAVLEKYNTRLAPRTVEVSETQILGDVTAALGFPPSDCGTVADAFFNFYQRSVTAYPETIDTLRRLNMLGVAVGVLTDVPYGMERARVEADLSATGIDGFVSTVLTSVEVGRRKPASVGFVRLATELDVPIGDLIYVGNEKKDIEGANAAGALSVLIDRESRQPDWGAWARIERLDEILGLL